MSADLAVGKTAYGSACKSIINTHLIGWLPANYKKYLREKNLLSSKTPNVTAIADDLQSKYSDYARKKKDAFRISVQKAFSEIQARSKCDGASSFSQSLVINESDDSEASFSPDTDKYTTYENSNSMNSLLQNIYRNSANNSPVSSRPQTPKDSNSNNRVEESVKKQNQNGPDLYFIDRMGEKSRKNLLGVKRKENDILDEIPKKVSPINARELIQDSQISVNNTTVDEISIDLQKQNKTLEMIQETEVISNSMKVKPKSKLLKVTKENGSIVKTPLLAKATKKTSSHLQQPTLTFADIGGNKHILKKLYKLMVHFHHHLVHDELGVKLPRGLLLHGPPGCGKTMLANAIAGELKLPLIQLAATEIVSGVSGESEEKVREIFQEAMSNSPCILFIDEIDAITPKREVASKDMEKRIVTQLLTCMDDLKNKPDAQVLVIGATNRPDSLDSSLRRAGRFDREIAIGIPDEDSRIKILHVLSRNLRLQNDFDFVSLARNTPGYVGADLVDLVGEATMIAVDRIFTKISDQAKISAESDSQQAVSLVTDGASTNNKQTTSFSSFDKDIEALTWLLQQPPMTVEQIGEVCITMMDFEMARQEIQPSSKREGFATIPGVTWDDVGSLKDIREELQMAILAPIQYPEKFRSFGIKKSSGILLIGPPGCGKTLLAKAIANESGINFISVKGPELFNMYVGESERAIRQVFQRARNSAPCLIFFDELDALCPDRNSGIEGGAKVQVVNTLLTEMDGAEERKQVFVMGATNKPDNIDDAMLRPGRLGKVLYVGLPTLSDRLDILHTMTRHKPQLAADVNLEKLAENCLHFSGADLAALVEEASLAAIRELMTSNELSTDNCVHKRHFDTALTKVRPSVSEKNRLSYEKMKIKYCASPSGS